MADVFISYSRKDKEFVQRLDEALSKREREAWVDWEGIRPTEEFMQSIYGAIEGADTFVFILSPDSISSAVCGKEIAHAAAHNKRMVPLVAREVIAADVPAALAKLQWISFCDTDAFEQATDTLITALDTDLDWHRAHKRLLTRAVEWEANEKNDSFVLRGDDLRAAELWLTEAGAEQDRQPTALQTEYIIGSRKAAARRQRWLLGGVTFAMIVTIALAIVAILNAGKANTSANAARQAEQEVKQSGSQAHVSLARYASRDGDRPRVLAHLAQALRLDSQNRVAASLTVSLLLEIPDHLPVSEPIKHKDRVSSAQFSPDGQRILTASADTARVWDAATGQPLGPPMTHQSSVESAQFSPDGRRVLTVSADAARVWDIATGQPLGDPIKHKDEDRVLSAQFSPDGRRVVTTSYDNIIRFWDAATGQPLGSPMKHQSSVESAQFSPDGMRLVTSSEKTVQVWDAATGQPLGRQVKCQSDGKSAHVSPDGLRLVTPAGLSAQVWDNTTGRPLGNPMNHESEVTSAQFSPDGQRVVTTSGNEYSGTSRIWDAATGQPLCEPMRYRAIVYSAQFSPDGQRVVTASADNTARVWDAATGSPLGEPMKHRASVFFAQFSPDGQRVLTTSNDHTSWVWDAASRNQLGDPMEHQAGVSSAQFSPDGQRVVTTSNDNTVQVWDAATGQPLGEPTKYENRVLSVQFSPDSQRVVTASEDNITRVWDAATGQSLGAPIKHDLDVHSAQFSPDGQRVVIALGSGDDMPESGIARVWDAVTGHPLGKPMEHRASVNSAQFSPDGRCVVTTSKGIAQIWAAATGQPLGSSMGSDYGGYIMRFAQFSPDGRCVVTVSGHFMGEGGGTACVWDTATSMRLGNSIEFEDPVQSARFSPDGQRVVTASGDTACVWDVATGKPVGEPLHVGSINSAQFSPDGQRVLTASGYTARVWDTPLTGTDDSKETSMLLADLAEVYGGVAFGTSNQAAVLEPLGPERVASIRKNIAEKMARATQSLTPVQRFLQWSVANRQSRTISPLSKLTLPVWIENRIKEGELSGLRDAMKVDPGNPLLTAHLGRCLADRALDKKTAPDKARLAKGDADFLTRRALKLAPDNAEIQKLWAEVEKLLGAPKPAAPRSPAVTPPRLRRAA